MEISFFDLTVGVTIRIVNVEWLTIKERVMIYFHPDTNKFHIRPLAEISDLDIEGGELCEGKEIKFVAVE